MRTPSMEVASDADTSQPFPAKAGRISTNLSGFGPSSCSPHAWKRYQSATCLAIVGSNFITRSISSTSLVMPSEIRSARNDSAAV